MPISKIIKIIKTYKNWPLFFLDRGGFLRMFRGKEIILKLHNGILFKARIGKRDGSMINEMWIEKSYFRHLTGIKDDTIVIDIGAHIGTFSVFVAKQARNTLVYSYEPCPENYILLRENIKLNNFEGNIKPFKLGVWSKTGKHRLFVHNNYTQLAAMYLKKGWKNKKMINIECTTLKNIFTCNKIDKCNLLKIDCEGAEYEILYNTPKEYLKRIETIVAELHFKDRNEPLKKYLSEIGFQVIIDECNSGYLLYAENKYFV